MSIRTSTRMMRSATRWTICLAAIAALAGSLAPARASCAARVITTSPSYLFTPGWPFTPECSAAGTSPSDGFHSCGGTMTNYATGFFWAWGGGSPLAGVGHDNGINLGQKGGNWGQEGGGWLQLPSPYWYGSYLYGAFLGGPFSHWQYPGTDGCISQTGSSSAPDVTECQVVVLNDVNGPHGYFFAMSVGPTKSYDHEFNAGQGFPSEITLVPVPTPQIDSAVASEGGMQLQVNLPVGGLTRENGFEFKCHGNPGEILTGWKLYARTYPSGGPEPASGESRAVAPTPTTVPNAPAVTPWQLVSGASTIPIGSPAIIDVPCGENETFVLCATLTFGGPSNLAMANNPDWELIYCSHSSAPVACETALAAGGQKKQKSMLRFDNRSAGPAVPKRR